MLAIILTEEPINPPNILRVLTVSMYNAVVLMKALSQLLRGRRAGGGGQTAMFAAKIILYLEQPNYPTSSSWPAASHSLAGPGGEQREYIYTLGVMKHCYANTSSTIMGPCTTYYICHDARVSSECIFQTSCVNTMCSAPANNRIGRNFLQIFIAELLEVLITCWMLVVRVCRMPPSSSAN